MFGQQNSTPFGSPPPGNTPFGSTANSTPAFGSPAPAFGGGGAFGSNTAGGGGGAFGATTTTSAFGTGGGGFGAPAPAPAFGFGAPTPAPTAFGSSTTNSSPFGAPAPPPSSGGLFGAPAPAPSGGLFGASTNNNNNAFGATNNNNAFGASTTNTNTFGGFGANTPATSTFGAPAPAPAFGAPAPATGGLFGAPAPAPAGGLFGSTPAPSPFGAPAPAPGLFGAPAPAPGGMFGAPAAAPQQAGGTHSKIAPFQATTRQDGTSSITFQSITAMNQYEQASFEEIRFGDYSQGNKGDGSGQASAGFGGFNSAPAPAPGGFGLFGGSTTPAPAPFGAPAFGAAPAPTAFGSPAPAPAFGAPAPAPAFGGFGAKPATGNLFGAPAPAPSGGGLFGSAPAPAFGSAPAPAGGLFGAPAPAPTGGLFGAPAPSGGGLFGSSPAPAFGAAPAPAGGNLFGAPAPAPAGGNLFGAPAPSGGLFGSAPAPGAFGAAPAGGGLFGAKPAGGSLFGAPAPAPTGMFGAPAPAPGGLFGQQAPAPAFASPMSQPANIMPQAADSVLQQQIVALQTQQAQLEKLEVWRGKTPQGASTIPASLSESEAGLRVSPYASSTSLTPYRASPKSTTIIRPRGFGSPAPTSAIKMVNSIGTRGTPMLSPGTVAVSSAKRLVIKPDAHTPKPRSRLQLTDRTVEEKKSDDRVTFAPTTTPAKLPDNSALRMETSQPIQTPEPVKSPPRSQSTKSRNSAYDLYRQVVGTPKENAPKQGGTIAPKLTKAEYTSFPPINELASMSESELAAVRNFSVQRNGIGSVAWEGAVDVRGVDLDSVVSIELMDVSVYEEAENAGTKPTEGAKLNRPAVITLHETYPKKGGAAASMEAKMKFSRKLEKTCEHMGTHFISYDVSTGTWKFRVNHFSRYGLYDDDDDDDEIMAIEGTQQNSQTPPAKPVVNFRSGERGGRSPMKKSPTRFTVPDSDDEEDGMDVVMGDDEAALVSDAEIEKSKERQVAAYQAYQELFLTTSVVKEPVRIEEDSDDDIFEDTVFESKVPFYQELFVPDESLLRLSGNAGITSRIAKECGVFKSSIDLGIRMGRSFRVGWRPDGSFMHIQSGSTLVQSRPVFSKAHPSAHVQVLEEHRKLSSNNNSEHIPSYSLEKHSLSSTVKTLAEKLEFSNDESSATIRMVFELLSCLLKDSMPSSAIVKIDGGTIIGSDSSSETAHAMEGFQRWLMQSCAQNVKKEIESALRENNAPKAIFSALSAGDISQAANLATSYAATASVKEHYAYMQLAVILASGTACSEFIHTQVRAWSGFQNSALLLRVYNLLSGDLSLEQQLFRAGDVSVDWMRRLGLLLKYGRKNDRGEFDFASLIQQYDSQVSACLAPPPQPLYDAPTEKGNSKSILYHIVRLCDAVVRRDQDKTVSLVDVVAPNGYTPISHDYSGAFLVASTLFALNCCTGLNEVDQMKLLHGYATQLIGEGNWQYAVYVMLCTVGDTSLRQWRLYQAKQIVLQNYRSHGDSTFLVDKIGIPAGWIAEASADRATNAGKTSEYLRQLACFSVDEARKALEDINIPAILFRNPREISKSVKILMAFPVDEDSLTDCVLELCRLSGEILAVSDDESEKREDRINSLAEQARQVEMKLSFYKSQQEQLKRPSLRSSKAKVPMECFISEALATVALMKLQLQVLEAGESIFDDKQGPTEKPIPFKVASQLMVAVGSCTQSNAKETIDLSVLM